MSTQAKVDATAVKGIARPLHDEVDSHIILNAGCQICRC